MSTPALMLADARFPAGGHAHSGGLEPAQVANLVTGLPALETFLLGRLRTVGVTAAGLARAACEPGADWGCLDAEADARTPSPAQRDASRRQGRALLRAARTAWPDAAYLNDLGRSPHHPIVLGAATAAAGGTPRDAARVAAYQSVAGPASAAIRLLALSPLEVAAILARLAPAIEDAADHSDSLPFPSAPALDLLAEAHARAEVRLFES